MIFYFSSPTYQPMITKVIKELDQMVVGNEIGEEIFFRKYIKENIRKFEQVELLLVDLTALADTDEEILVGLESLKVMDYTIRIIVLAPTRTEGDPLLRSCFYMGIYDMIDTDEYLKIHDDLTHCFNTGMNYRDALRFRVESESENGTDKKATRKILIGLTGTGQRMGCTHSSIVLANFLRNRNLMVAVVEMNSSGAFEAVRESKKETLYEEGYYTIKGVDYIPCCDPARLQTIIGRMYDYLLLDFGDYDKADKVLLNKCDVKIVLSGSKPWETGKLQGIFKEQDEIVLKSYHFCFLFTSLDHKLQKEIIKNMEPLENVYFPEYQEDPFEANDFPEGFAILKNYLAAVNQKDKKDHLLRMPWKKK